MLRMYGYDGAPVSIIEGVNARPSELQSAFLRIRLKHLNDALARRTENATKFATSLDPDKLPATSAHTDHSYHQFVLQIASREHAAQLFDHAGIEWGIHYEMPVHLMPAFRDFGRPLPITETAANHIISIPVHENLTPDEVNSILNVLMKL